MNLTVILPYYCNPTMLARQYDNWMDWPSALRKRLKVIITDDGSPQDEQAIDVPRPPGVDIEIYRVMVDIPWGQNRARNIAASVAPEGWMLLTDADHMLAPKHAEALFRVLDSLHPGSIYMMDRIEADTGKPTLNSAGQRKPHPNTFIVTRHTFWDVIEGYDLEYAGYGTDSVFRARAFQRAARGHLYIPITRYWRDIVPDASTRTLGRKGSEHQCPKAEITERKRREGREHEVRKMDDVPWERIV